MQGPQEIVINFDYDGVIPSAHAPSYSRNTSLLNPLAHPIRIEAIDVNGNVGEIEFVLFSEAFQPLSKISGDNQRGVPNTPLALPFVVELRNSDNGWGEPGVPVTFRVTAGGGTLSVIHTTTATTPWKNGRAESTLTLGPNPGINTVEVSAAGIEGMVIFHAIAETESPPITADVNGDGVVNVLDLVVITSNLGNTGENIATDVNGDRIVNILDLIWVAGMFDGAAAAPSAHSQVPETLTTVEVQEWLTEARDLRVGIQS